MDVLNDDAKDGLRLIGAWCRDQGCVRNGPCPRFGSDGADIARASQLQHTVEDINRHVDFGRPTLVRLWCNLRSALSSSPRVS
jgi:hypothetical protein